MAAQRPLTRWWQIEDRVARGREVWGIATGLESDQQARISRACESLSVYEDMKIDSLASSAYLTGQAVDEDRALNISRTGCAAVQAEIAGRQKPTARMQTHGGNWKSKRQARRMEKYVEGVFRQRHGPYMTTWDMAEEVFLDCTIIEAGVIKVFGIPARKDKEGNVLQPARVTMERCISVELFVDPQDARYRNPNSLFAIYPMDRDKALWMFADDPSLDLTDEERAENRVKVEMAPTFDDVQRRALNGASRGHESIKIVEAWRRRLPNGEPGMHVFAVDGLALVTEEWDRDTFPFVRILWSKHRWGWGGRSLLEEGKLMADGLAKNYAKLTQRIDLSSNKRTYYEEDSIVNESQLQRNSSEEIIKVKKGTQFLPIDVAPNAFAPAEVDWMQMHYEMWFRITRMSEMRATARKETGLEAAVAIRTVNDMQASTFSVISRAYENLFVDLAQQIILCSRELYAAGEDPCVYLPEKIKWSEVDMPENTFEITGGAASALPNDVPGRISLAGELADRQVITPQMYAQMTQMPDLEDQINQLSAQERYIEKVVDTFLDAKSKAGANRAFISPDSLIPNKPMALLQVGQAYMHNLVEGAPEYCLDLLRRYIQELESMISAEKLKMQQMQAEMNAMVDPTAGGGGQPAATPPMQ